MRKERTGRHNSICREFGRIFREADVSYPRLGAQQKPADRYYNRPDRPSREKTGGFIPSFCLRFLLFRLSDWFLPPFLWWL